MSSLNVGIVGCGHIALERHIPALRKIKAVNLVAVADTDPAQAGRIASMLDIPHSYPNLSEMLDGENLHIVDICTPPRTHAQLAIEAMEKGCNVLVEKPMAVCVDEAEQMVATSQRRHVILSTVHNYLFRYSLRKARHLFSQGKVGDIILVEVMSLTSPEGQIPQWTIDLPGGFFFEEGPHRLYSALAFLGNVESIEAKTRKYEKLSPLPVDCIDIMMRNKNATCHLNMFFAAPRSEWIMTVVGTKAILHIDVFRDIIAIMGRRDASHSDLPCPP